MRTFVAAIMVLCLFTFFANMTALSLGTEGRRAANPVAIIASAAIAAWAAWLIWGGAA